MRTGNCSNRIWAGGIALGLLVLMGCSPGPPFLRRKLDQFDAGGRPLNQIAADLSRRLKVPYSFEWPAGVGNRPAQQAVYEKATVRRILDGVTREDGEYIWEFQHGVLSFIPVARLKEADYLLNQKVDTLDLQHVNILGALHQLGKLPPFQTAVINLNGRSNLRTFDVSLTGATLREAVNAVAGGDGEYNWVLAPSNILDVTHGPYLSPER